MSAKVPTPPADVLTGRLQGGPYDGIVFEIEGESVLHFKGGKSLLGPAPEVRYEYTGSLNESGEAVYEFRPLTGGAESVRSGRHRR